MKRTTTTKKTSLKSTLMFPIVGVGASAGGLEAIAKLLAALPPDSGIALILVQHLAPSHESLTTEILSRKTKMQVVEIKDRMRVEPNHVYVIPPNYYLAIQNRVLKLSARPDLRSPHMSIDFFFQSLAWDQYNRAVGVILSGTATDGTIGLEAIKAEGGLTFAQEPQSAKYDGMPRSAITAGVVDHILAPEQIAKELDRIGRHPLLIHKEIIVPLKKEDVFDDILMLLRNQVHADFTHYKKSTLRRRIARRMVIMKKDKLENYLACLKSNPNEVKALFADVLINVTSFFRDPSAFIVLNRCIFPRIFKGKPRGAPIRIWIAGCSTGEEAYSVAISLIEFMEKEKLTAPIQIFATDISETAIQKARLGVFTHTITQTVSQDHLKRYFVKIESGYKVTKFIRDLCLFSKHNVTTDPPFAKLDLICCRNLLIYFEPVLQKRVIALFHYALNSGGVLWLGKSETITSLLMLFSLTDKINKFYTRKPAPTSPNFRLTPSFYTPPLFITTKNLSELNSKPPDVQNEADKIGASRYVPPNVVVNQNMEIILARGDTAPWLQLPTGQASLSLFKMARPEIVTELRMVLQAAKKQNAPARRNCGSFIAEVVPISTSTDSKEHHFVIFFEPITDGSTKLMTTKRIGSKDPRIKELERLLAESKIYQKSFIEDFEATQEELTSSNEELQSTNEELQSTNEELETAKEELQSTNEELTTVNEELQNRNMDLGQLNNDLVNLLGCIDIPIVMVNSKGLIRRFTPKASKIMSLIPTDIGRPINDIKQSLEMPDLMTHISEVIKMITMREFDVQDREGFWFRLQIRPYKTVDNRIDGAVIILVDINTLKRNASEGRAALEHATSIANTVPLPIVVLDHELRIQSGNNASFEKLHLVKEDFEKDFISTLGGTAWRAPRLREILMGVVKSNTELNNFEIEYDFPRLGHRILILNARQIQWIGPETQALLLSIEDVTERRQLEKGIKEAFKSAERANQAKDTFLATLSHEMRTPLTAILTWSQLLLRAKVDPEKLRHAIKTIEQSATTQKQLIDDLLDISRIQSGKLLLNMNVVCPADVVRGAINTVRHLADNKAINIEVYVDPKIEKVFIDPARLQQIIWNLLTNAIKFSPANTVVQVRLEPAQRKESQYLSIKVIDHGRGIGPEFLPHVFERFSQADSSAARLHGGLGLGLAIVRDLLKMQNGTIHAESAGKDKGATFTVMLPFISDGSHAEFDQKKNLTPSHRPALAVATPLVDLSGLTILFVEDDPNQLEALTETLTTFGANVTPVASALSALEALKQSTPDIVISDIAMPGEDGYTLIRKIKELRLDKDGSIPLVALTAYAAQEDINRALAAGFNAHLAKPVDTDQLVQTINRLTKTKLPML